MNDTISAGEAAGASIKELHTDNQRLLNILANLIQKYLHSTINHAFDTLDDSLFELANSARTNNEQSCYFDAMRETRIKRKSVEEYTNKAIPLFVMEPKRAQILFRGQQSNIKELSIVKNTDLEEMVCIESLANKVATTFSGELLLSQQRLHHLYQQLHNKPHKATSNTPGDTIKQIDHANILDPLILCRVIGQSCSLLEIEPKERLLVLQHIGYQLIESYGTFLERVNKLLVDNGILPSLQFKSQEKNETQHSKQDATQESATSRRQEGTKKDASASAHTQKHDSYSELQKLLASIRNSQSKPSHNWQTNETPIDEQGLLNLLTSIKQQHTPDNLAEGRAELLNLQQLVQNTLQNNNTPKYIEQSDDDAINLVSMLFEFILDDYNLSAPIQVLISRLQIPIVKMVIKDPSFFSKSTHPARRLLNSLAKAGIGWSDAAEKSKDKLYDQIHNTVRKILEDDTGEIALYEQLYISFQQFLEREGRRSSIIEERTKEAEIGRIKTQKAQAVVKSTLKEIIATQPLPVVAQEILENGWSRVMFLAYLKDNKENRWNETVQVAKELVWCLSPLTDTGDRIKWTRTAPLCIKALKKGLQEVSYNSSGLNESLTDLKAVLAETFKNPESIHTQTRPPAPPPPQQPKPVAEESMAHAKHHEAVSNLSVGDWIQYSLINGSHFRCKLSAKIIDPDCYIFVNRVGLKIIEKSQVQLAEDLAAGKLAILEQGLLVDRALNAVVGNLRKMNAKQA